MGATAVTEATVVAMAVLAVAGSRLSRHNRGSLGGRTRWRRTTHDMLGSAARRSASRRGLGNHGWIRSRRMRHPRSCTPCTKFHTTWLQTGALPLCRGAARQEGVEMATSRPSSTGGREERGFLLETRLAAIFGTGPGTLFVHREGRVREATNTDTLTFGHFGHTVPGAPCAQSSSR